MHITATIDLAVRYLALIVLNNKYDNDDVATLDVKTTT